MTLTFFPNVTQQIISISIVTEENEIRSENHFNVSASTSLLNETRSPNATNISDNLLGLQSPLEEPLNPLNPLNPLAELDSLIERREEEVDVVQEQEEEKQEE